MDYYIIILQCYVPDRLSLARMHCNLSAPLCGILRYDTVPRLLQGHLSSVEAAIEHLFTMRILLAKKSLQNRIERPIYLNLAEKHTLYFKYLKCSIDF